MSAITKGHHCRGKELITKMVETESLLMCNTCVLIISANSSSAVVSLSLSQHMPGGGVTLSYSLKQPIASGQ